MCVYAEYKTVTVVFLRNSRGVFVCVCVQSYCLCSTTEFGYMYADPLDIVGYELWYTANGFPNFIC